MNMRFRSFFLSASLASMLVLGGCGDSGPQLPSGHSAESTLNNLLEGSPLERERAARDLAALAADLQHPAIAQALLVATEDHQVRVQIAAVRALGEAKEGAALNRLLELAAPGSADGLRQAPCVALGQLGNEKAIAVLNSARESEVLTIRVAATMALANCGAEGEQVLISAWEKTGEENGPSKAAIIQALATTQKEQYFPLFREALSLKHQSVVSAAAQAIAKFPSDLAIPALLESMEQRSLRADMAVPLLLSIDRTESLPAVVNLLSQAAAAEVAVKHLKEIHAPALPSLHSYFANEQATGPGRILALDLILAITEQAERGNEFSDVRVIHNAYRLPDKYDRLTIRLSEHLDLIEKLSAQLTSPQIEIRFAVAKLFAWQGIEAGLPPLIAMADQKFTPQNAAVWQAIARYRDEARKRDKPTNSLAKDFAPLAENAAFFISVGDKEHLAAHTGGSTNSQPKPGRIPIETRVSLQISAVKIAAALQLSSQGKGTEATDIADQVSAWAMRNNWQRNPRNLRHLGTVAREEIAAWNSAELRQRAWQAYQKRASDSGLMTLGQLGVVEAIPDLIQAMEVSNDSRYTINAMRSASLIAASERGTPDLRSAVSNAVTKVLRKSPPQRNMQKRQINDFAQAGIPALQKLSDPGAVETLIFLIKQPQNPLFPLGYGKNTAGLAAKALARFEHRDGPGALVQLLKAEDIDIAQKNSIIAPAIVQSGQAALVDSLLELMQEQAASERAQDYDPGFLAADILGAMGEKILPQLSARVAETDLDKTFAQRMARSLALINHPDAIPALAKLLESPELEVVLQALVSLGQNKQSESLISLRKFAEKPHEDKDIRQTLSWAIAQHQ